MADPAQEHEPSSAVIERTGVAWIAASSGVSAAAGYVVILTVVNVLTKADASRFQVYWSVLLAGFALLGGLQQETTRAVGSVRETGSRGGRVLIWSLLMAAGVAGVAAATAAWWMPRALPGQPLIVLMVLLVAVVAFGGHVTTVGALAGARRWSWSAALVGAEGVARMLVVLAVALVAPSLSWFEIAATLSAIVWLIWLVLPAGRWLLTARADVDAPALLRRFAHTTLASVGTALLIVGFPTLLSVTTPADQMRTSAPLLLALSLTRAPLLLPLTAFQGVAIAHFQSRPDGGLVRLVASIGALGAVVAGAAWAAGPTLLVWLVDPGYRVDGPVLAGLACAATMLAVLVLTGSVVLAVDRHRIYVVGWLVATLVTVLALLLPGTLEHRTVVSLTVGPLVGATIHWWFGLRTAGRARRRTAS